MAWWKKEIFYTLSILLVTLSSCELSSIKAEDTQNEIKQEKEPSKKDLIDDFFIHIQDRSSHSIQLIDSLGKEISKKDSLLTFFPYVNEFEHKSFVFASKHKEAFQAFEKSNFLEQSKAIQQASYKVWRKRSNDLQILDISVEPHPTLDWVFIVRWRGQE